MKNNLDGLIQIKRDELLTYFSLFNSYTMQDGFGIGRGLGLGRIHVYAKNDLFFFLKFEAN